MFKRIRITDVLLALLLILVIVVLTYPILLRPIMLEWGADDSEVAAVYPADVLIESPDLVSTRGIDIDAAPDSIWPLLSRFGQKNDTKVRWTIRYFNEKAKDRIFHSLLEIGSGDTIQFVDDDGDSILAVANEPRELTLYVAEPDTAEGRIKMSWSFYVTPSDEGGSRLLSRQRITYGGDLKSWIWRGVVEPMLFHAERLFLRYVRDRAEASYRRD
jgi:hypothetical protein